MIMLRQALSRLWIAVLALLALCGTASAGQTVTGIACSRSAFYDASTNGATQLVPSTTATLPAVTGTIYICGYTITTSGMAVNVGFVFGTGTNCATGQTKITPAYEFAATTAGISGIVDGAQQFRGLTVPDGQNLCINTNAGQPVQAIIYYDQF